MTGEPLHVTFICHGNICRSPMAANVFRHQIHQRGLSAAVRVTSAGIHGAWHTPGGADHCAVSVLREHGYPTRHRATQLGPEHLAADLIVAMDRHNVRALITMGAAADRVRLLRTFEPAAGDRTPDVANPWSGGRRDFETTLRVIERVMPGLHRWTAARVGHRASATGTR